MKVEQLFKRALGSAFAVAMLVTSLYAATPSMDELDQESGAINTAIDLVIHREPSLDGNGYNGSLPTKLDSDRPWLTVGEEIVSVAAGADHTIVLVQDMHGNRSLYAVGSNASGQLGLGNTTPREVFTKITSGIPTTEQPVMVSAGEKHTMVITEDASGRRYLYATGDNSAGQGGLGATIEAKNIFTKVTAGIAAGEQPVFVACGKNHSMVITQNATGTRYLYGTGSNGKGQLCIATEDPDKRVLTKIPTDSLPANEQPVFVTAGDQHTLVVTTGGSDTFLYVAGTNSDGQLANGYALNQKSTYLVKIDLTGKGKFFAVKAGGLHTLVIMTDTTSGIRKVYTAGRNVEGQLGITAFAAATVLTEVTAPTPAFSSTNNPIALAAGLNHSAIITSDKSLYTTGQATNGQLGNVTFTPNISVFAPVASGVVGVSAGGYYTHAITENVESNRVLYATGKNDVYQLGLSGDTADRSSFTCIMNGVQPCEAVRAVVEGYGHSMVLTDSGDTTRLYGVGDNGEGQLGLGVTTPSFLYTFSEVINVELPIDKVAAGKAHTVAIMGVSDYVFGTGDNSFGQLGIASYVDKTSFTTSSVAATAIAAGANHTLALASAGGVDSVLTAGDNTYKQLGRTSLPANQHTLTAVAGSTYLPAAIVAPVVPIAIAGGGEHSLVIAGDPSDVATNSLYAAGSNSYGQCGLGLAGQADFFTKVSGFSADYPVAIACGGAHSLVITDDGIGNRSLYVAGRNNSGQLGLGNTTSKNSFTKVTIGISADEDIREVAAGDAYSLVVTKDPAGNYCLYAAGRNSEDQLGFGDASNRLIFTKVFTIARGLVPFVPTTTYQPSIIQMMRSLLLGMRLDAATNNNA